MSWFSKSPERVEAERREAVAEREQKIERERRKIRAERAPKSEPVREKDPDLCSNQRCPSEYCTCGGGMAYTGGRSR